jgi:gliding motility-associated-like protein
VPDKRTIFQLNPVGRVKISKYIVLAIVVLFLGTLRAYPQGNSTNIGTDFWTAYMDHVDGAGGRGSQMDLYITSSVNTSGNVMVADGSFSSPFIVIANQVSIIQIPASAFLGDFQGTFLKGIHITSVNSVAIYAHIFSSAVSGATLLLPVNSMGKDYYSINYTQTSNSLSPQQENKPSYSIFMVIATQDNTTVEITPSAFLLDGTPPGKILTVQLSKGQVYQGLSNNDLSGTRIQSISTAAGSCTKIAVFSGSSKIQIGCGNTDMTSDNLFQQVYPTATWGKNYITVPLDNRPFDIYRIVLSTPNTNVTLNGAVLSPAQFLNGFYYEFTSTIPNIITADQPIQVVQYSVTQGKTLNCQGTTNGDVGDPEMIFLNPLEQTIDHVTLFSTSNYNILSNYINVVIKANAASTFTLDGNPYTSFIPVPGNPQYAYAQVPVLAGTHNIKASDGFNAIAYGFGIDESYGYAAGANLQDLNEYVVLENLTTDSTQTNGCTAVNYKLQVVLPYQTTSIKWDFKNGTVPFTDNNPVLKTTIQKGTQTLYVYEYPNIVNYNSGSYSVVATVFNPLGDVCGSNVDIELDFNISDPPTAKFVFSKACFGDSTAFRDSSFTANNTIKTWRWDFGDNQTSIVQNPLHLFASPGDYPVQLTVNNQNGCSSVYQQTVHISKNPVASFQYSAPDCLGLNILFTDQSASTEGPITQWIWDYGDRTPTETRTDNKPFNHLYANTGPVTIKLSVVLGTGCISDSYLQTIKITPLPVVDFTLPDVCLTDAYAQFTDMSTIADSTQAGFNYKWDFGDLNSSPAFPNTSTGKNPQHKYTQVGIYQVTLTVQSKFGCVFSRTQPFTVNGDIPKAAFLVENSNNLCSSDDVIFDDLSTVNFGNITKIIWYFDYNNNPTDSTVFLKGQFPADRKFHHNYGIFNSPLKQNYAVVMRVYSGQSCFEETPPQTITINSNPTITLSQIGTICQDSDPVQIVENKNGFSGIGVFQGAGVSSTGLFNPSAAGPGAVTINYTFMAQNGCTYTTSEQITVNPSPKVSAGEDLTVLEGGQAAIKATASGNGLIYQWVPSTGLDHTDVLNPVASPLEDTNYKLIVTSADGCSAADDVLVRVLKNLVVPNAFTPNGDGINDTWKIKYLDSYPNNTVEIYNRYGERLYSSIGYPVPWDGRYKGADLPAGTYYYIINPKNGRTTIAGSVTIIR